MTVLLVCSYQMGSDTFTSLVTCIKLPGVLSLFLFIHSEGLMFWLLKDLRGNIILSSSHTC